MTLLVSTFEGEVGADQGLFARLARVVLDVLGIGNDLLNLLDLVASSCVLGKTSSSDVSEFVSVSDSDDTCSASASCSGEYVGSSCSSSDSSLKKS